MTTTNGLVAAAYGSVARRKFSARDADAAVGSASSELPQAEDERFPVAPGKPSFRGDDDQTAARSVRVRRGLARARRPRGGDRRSRDFIWAVLSSPGAAGSARGGQARSYRRSRAGPPGRIDRSRGRVRDEGRADCPRLAQRVGLRGQPQDADRRFASCVGGRSRRRPLRGEQSGAGLLLRRAADALERTAAGRPAGRLPARAPIKPPVRSTRLIGREGVVRQLLGGLQRRRFVTIVGPGGIGKTSVAVAVAEALEASCKSGVCFVDLSRLSGPVARDGCSGVGAGRRSERR